MTSEPRTSTARGDDRKRQLLTAAIECVTAEGWPGLTHRKVAARAGANLGLVRYHFGDLAGLRTAVAREVSGSLSAPIAELFSTVTSRDEWVARASELVTGPSEPRAEVALLLQVMVGSLTHPDVAEIVRADVDAMRAGLRDSLLALPDAPTRAHAERASAFALSLADGLALTASVAPGPDTRDLVRRAIAAVLSE